MDHLQTFFTALLGSGIATATIVIAVLKWIESRANTYIDTNITEKIKSDHAAKLEELRSDLAGKIESLKSELATQIEFRKFELPVYKELWDALAAAKIAGDVLWKEATTERLITFRDKLAQAEQKVNALAPLLPEDDCRQLATVVEEFQNYGIGKEGLLREKNRLADRGDLDNWRTGFVESNRERWSNYNKLLNKLQANSREHLHRPLQSAAPSPKSTL